MKMDLSRMFVVLTCFCWSYTSARVEAGQRRVLDDATRQRRLTRQLEALEKDNFQVSLVETSSLFLRVARYTDTSNSI